MGHMKRFEPTRYSSYPCSNIKGKKKVMLVRNTWEDLQVKYDIICGLFERYLNVFTQMF